MAALHRSVASLRIFGDTLNPEEISRTLDCQPSESFVKGQIKHSKHRDIVRKTGAWLLKAADRTPGDLDAQVKELFSRVNLNPAIWVSLAGQYQVDIFCGFFMKETDEGFEVSPETMKVLVERGIKLGVCIYAPLKDLNPADPCPCGSGKTYADCCVPRPAK